MLAQAGSTSKDIASLSFPRASVLGLMGLKQQSRRASGKSLALTASPLLPSQQWGGRLSPRSGCSQLVPTGCDGRGVLFTSVIFKDTQLWVF